MDLKDTNGLKPDDYRILSSSYDWGVDSDGFLMGLCNGDQGWESTSIRVNPPLPAVPPAIPPDPPAS